MVAIMIMIIMIIMIITIIMIIIIIIMNMYVWGNSEVCWPRESNIIARGVRTLHV